MRRVGYPDGRPTMRTTLLIALLLRTGSLAGVARAEDVPPDAEVPAQDDAEPSIWTYIESADGAIPTPSTVQATAELVEERTAELGYTGVVGAAPPVAYYLDPVGATDLDPLHLDKVDPKEFDIPIVVNDEVISWMRYFLGSGRKYYHRYLERSTRWLPMMHRELKARGLPKDLIYLSMIESGFSTGATSYVSAAGLWQFMPYTGRDYGLRIDWWVDERRDPELSTKAALRYLSDLNKMFAGDWMLSWASYNGGQGRVMKATRRAGSTDFWTLARGNFLHPETDNYVPKIMAAAILGKHPERYGFVGVKYLPAFDFDAVNVPASTRVDVIARCGGVTSDAFQDLNPGLRRFALPPEPASQRVRVAKGAGEGFQACFDAVPEAERITQLQRHIVKRGESLAGIARKYKVPVAELARTNNLSTKARLRVGTELVVPIDQATGKAVEVEPAASQAATTPKETKGAEKNVTTKAPASKAAAAKTHVVRQGDTLSGLATTYGVDVKDLQTWNHLKGSNIQAGQKLIVAAPSDTGAAAPEAGEAKPEAKGKTATKAKPKVVKYTVKRGDTLGSIADRYGCTIAELKAWNNLRGSTIYAGQKLVIKG